MVLGAERVSPDALSLVNKALGSLFGDPNDVFLRARAERLLFRGVPIDCSHQEFEAQAICSQIRSNPKGLQVVSKNLFKFSLFGSVSRQSI